MTFFGKIAVLRSKYCLEFSKFQQRLKNFWIITPPAKIFGVFLVTYLRLSEVVFFIFYYQDITICVRKIRSLENFCKKKHPLEFFNES